MLLLSVLLLLVVQPPVTQLMLLVVVLLGPHAVLRLQLLLATICCRIPVCSMQTHNSTQRLLWMHAHACGTHTTPGAVLNAGGGPKPACAALAACPHLRAPPPALQTR
jgi:hypothetical protein